MCIMGWFEGCHKILYIEYLPQNRRTVNVIFCVSFPHLIHPPQPASKQSPIQTSSVRVYLIFKPIREKRWLNLSPNSSQDF